MKILRFCALQLFALLCLSPLVGHAQTTISSLPNATTLTGTERVPADQGTCTSCTVNIELSQIGAYVDSIAGGINLATGVTGNLSVSHLNGGAGANSTSFWNGAGNWVVPVVPSANPTALVGLAAIGGVSSNFMKADAAPALNTSISPTMSGSWVFRGATSTPVTIVSPSSGQAFAINNLADTAQYFIVNTTGATSIQNVTSGVALAVTGSGLTTPIAAEAGASNEALRLDSTASTGPYMDFERNSVAFGYIGNSGALGGSALDNLAVRGEAGIDFITNHGTHVAATFSTAGNETINPSSGTALTVNSAVAGNGIQVNTTSAQTGMTIVNPAAFSIGLNVLGGAATELNVLNIQENGQHAWLLAEQAGGDQLFFQDTTLGTVPLTLNGTLGVATNLPLNVNGSTAGFLMRVNNATDSAQSFLSNGITHGIRFEHGTTGSSIDGVDNTGTGSFQPIQIQGTTVGLTATGTGTGLFVSADGGLTAGAPTGGDKGPGTLNVSSGLFINGVAVGSGGGGGAISATTGTFSGALTAASYSGGPISGTTGTFSGAVSVTASSGYAVTSTAPSSSIFSGGAALFGAPNTAGHSNGVRIIAGTNSSDSQLILTNAANNANYWIFDGGGSLYTNGLTPLGQGTINVAGCFVNGAACLTSVGANSLTGATLAAGVTVSSLTSLGTLTGLNISGAENVGGVLQGGAFVGTGATGGSEGTGTGNFTAIFVNGVAVGASATTGTFTCTTSGLSGATMPCAWTKTGNSVTLFVGPATGSTGTGTSFSIGNLPTAIQAATNKFVAGPDFAENNSSLNSLQAQVNGSSLIFYFNHLSSGWTVGVRALADGTAGVTFVWDTT